MRPLFVHRAFAIFSDDTILILTGLLVQSIGLNSVSMVYFPYLLFVESMKQH